MSDSLLRMPCPSCGKRIKYGSDDAGTEAFCPHCDTPVVLKADAPPPPPKPGISKQKLMMVGIPVACFVVVFGLITTAAIIMKKGEKRTRTEMVEVDGKMVEVEVEIEDGKPRKASPKVPMLKGYKRPLKLQHNKKLTFNNPTPRKNGDPTQLMGHKIINAESGSMQYVVGIVKNHTGKRFFDVEVFFDLLNDKGRKIGEAKDYVGILSPNGSWDFKCTIFVRGAKKAKLNRINKVPE